MRTQTTILKSLVRLFAQSPLLFIPGLSPSTLFLQSVPTSTSLSTIMDASFAFWFPVSWKILGCLFTIFSFFLSLFVAIRRRDSIESLSEAFVRVIETTDAATIRLREVQREVEALSRARTPHGESNAETLRALRELSIDLQALASTVRETCGVVIGSITEM